jgi:CRISPR-associated endonuclease/helicase Cas3
MATRRYAHSLPHPSQVEQWEDLRDHLRRVAMGPEPPLLGSTQFAESFNAAEWGRLLGLWHDLGKYSDAFQAYLRASAGAAEGLHHADLAGRVDHSTAGAQHAARLGPLGRLLAYAIAGHHAGLPDHEDEAGGSSGLRSRLAKSVEPYDAAPHEILDLPLPPLPRFRSEGGRRRHAFTVAFFTRMLFSCLVDADYLATEWFLDPDRSRRRPADMPSPAELLARLDDYLGAKQQSALPSEVNRLRGQILAACRTKATLPPGFFSLNVPTGGGKTLSSLAFALTHAVTHGLRRVVYAIPFTSIIEQAADVFREALGDLGEHVLEHHSNLEPDDPARQSDRSRLAAENFDAPVVVTTNVQLFESLFADRPSRCRKLHRLARSVIVLDEAQALPSRLLAPTLAALEELVRNYGATVVLCTATQPAVERREGFPIGLEGVRPIVDDPVVLHAAMRRTRVEPAGPLGPEELARRLRGERQALCVVNSRRHASDLFRALDDTDALHLSASMCAAHRSDVIRAIRDRIERGHPCRVVSTQVIEAGVDVDFPAVYRAAAGLDSIAQAAGRCNREGRLVDEHGNPRPGRVVVFEYDTKAYPTDTTIACGAAHYRQVAPDHAADLLAPAAIEAYFRLHYWRQGGDDGRGWDHGIDGRSILDCFELDRVSGLHAQFRVASRSYRLIDDAQAPVLVPYGGQGRTLIRELEAMPDAPEPGWLRAFDRRAQRYVVGVYDQGLRTLLANGVLLERHGRWYLANPEAYEERLGLRYEALGLDPERMVI